MVTAPKRFRIGKKLFRKASVLGRGASRANAGTITVRLTKPAVKAIRTGKVKRVKISVTSSDGTARSKVLRVKRG